MKKMLLISCFIAAMTISYSQSQKIEPGKTFINQTTDTLFILQTKQLKALLTDAVNNDINLEKLKLYQKKINLNEERINLADSAILIKRLEADYWRQQLFQNDQLLETQRLENLKLIDDRNRIRQSRVYYLVAGFVAGAIVISL